MKKKFLIVLLIFCLIVVIVSIIFIYTLRKREESISLIDDYITIEYGEKYLAKISNLIDLSKYDFADEDDIEIEDNIKKEKGKEYPSVGKYKVKLKYKDIVLIQTVIVKDTIAPEITMEDKVEIPFGTDLNTFDFRQYAKIDDLSEIKDFEVNFDDVDVNVSGEYTAKLIVSDEYSNVSEKEFTIFIQEQQEEKINENIIEETNNIQVENTEDKNKNSNTQKREQEIQPQTEVQVEEQPTSNEPQENNSISQENDIPNNQEEYSNTEPIVETPPVQEVPEEEKIFCIDGGPIHFAGDGENEHGYYNSWDEAWEACKEYMKDMKSGHYKVSECLCGKFYFWVEEN